MAQPLQRKLFTYNLKKDVVLLREVVSVNPYMDTGKWKEVLDNFVISLDLLKLNPGGSKPTERSCTDRIGNLIIKFNKAELASIRASGSDEELNERYELIREAKHLKEEAEIQNQKAKDKKRNKEQEDEAKAKEVRKRAMEGLGPVRKEDQSDEGRPAGKKQRATNVLLDYLREKNDKDVALREREMQLSHERALLELKLREKELVLREKELSIKMETMKKN